MHLLLHILAIFSALAVALSYSSNSCSSSNIVCINGKCKSDQSSTCGGGASGKPVITCDDSSFFSGSSLCAPGVCCPTIPSGIRFCLISLTVMLAVLFFIVFAGSPPSRGDPSKQKLVEPQANQQPDPQLHLVAPYSASNPTYQPDPINPQSLSAPAAPSAHAVQSDAV
ncbi:hypothetical protein PRIPAC_83961 [Pristionchus pacificus]|uniref:Uncharacterized protein n=1 Tax=Pristionchus pacificus TaxID=54126 RepID=A0A2A6BKU2_PRIPA|nr:hypothetical protein PRIPAC_83961 [Pristionchus pacificus]|eukprot:PDM66443.1 hypothetical protein PRIPAC_47860 [Pristionchus pacificus]